ncbi:hypothetical protein [Dyadobacter pollutisoli]|jgi:hypothetical protein|uniref:Uncharacterized protein n=1 Tax=Dyadobacter pollutisoli TaxID=2910158 RepID=A0A9E8SJW6_9BACT|nr:hypothetical protein [Dyadobacter pollutisoli]WAC11805.1 hypothetical protein ON006_29240 [Dyadobacter pollutisoli]
MQHIKYLTLAAMLLAASLQHTALGKHKSIRQPYPQAGFWVTENKPGEQSTTVRYYANSNYLVSESVEPSRLDISRVSVRKYLNRKLKMELDKDTTLQSAPKLYEIN